MLSSLQLKIFFLLFALEMVMAELFFVPQWENFYAARPCTLLEFQPAELQGKSFFLEANFQDYIMLSAGTCQ